MLGERATTEIHRTEDSRGVAKLRSDAKAGGDIAGGARRKLEGTPWAICCNKEKLPEKSGGQKEIEIT